MGDKVIKSMHGSVHCCLTGLVTAEKEEEERDGERWKVLGKYGDGDCQATWIKLKMP